MATNTEFNIDISPKAQAQLFTDARTTYNWLDVAVSDEVIEAAWDLAKFAPTAMNISPLRFKVVRSAEARKKLVAACDPGNQAKVETAPVPLILAYSKEFYRHMGTLFPNMPSAETMLSGNPEMSLKMAQDNAWLQVGYLIEAFRAIGLGVAPMTGANFGQIAADFYAGDSHCVPFLLMNIGFAANPASDYPRNPRLTYAEVSANI